MLTGPRATGKTTTAARHARSIARLDREAERSAFEADPDGALAAYSEPVLIDEWHLAPGVLGAVKRAVDSGSGGGRFLITGSARGKLKSETWPGTGRIVDLRMEGLTRRELSGALDGPTFLDRLSGDISDGFSTLSSPPGLVDYVDMALRGGFPEIETGLSEIAAKAWLGGYVDQLLTRDIDLLDERRDPEKMRRYFEALCLNTTGVPDHSTLYEAAGIDAHTAKAYDRLLENLFISRPIPAWSSNRVRRLVKSAKQLIVDPALAGSALSLSRADVMRDGNMIGRLIETFAIGQIRAEAEALGSRFRLHHLRDKGGAHEIDLIAEVPGGDLIAIEIKATSAPSRSDARHIRWLREQAGSRVIAGCVLHTGPIPLELDEAIYALPLYSLWTQS